MSPPTEAKVSQIYILVVLSIELASLFSKIPLLTSTDCDSGENSLRFGKMYVILK